MIMKPLKLTKDTLCIGRTQDRRAVWQNGKGPPFISIHDARQVQHLITVATSEIEHIDKPYTRGSLDL